MRPRMLDSYYAMSGKELLNLAISIHTAAGKHPN